MRNSIRPAAIILLVLVSSTVGFSQETLSDKSSLLKKGLLGPGVEPGVYTKAGLLYSQSIQDELKLTPEQRTQLAKAEQKIKRLEDIDKKEREALRARGDQQSLRLRMQRAVATSLSLTPPMEAPLFKVLDRRQNARLEQILLQAEGPRIFLRPEVRERLNLDPDQTLVIQSIVTQSYKTFDQVAKIPARIVPKGRITAEQRQSLLESEASRAEMTRVRERVIQARQSMMQSISRVLTKTQRARLQKMLGTPYEFENPLDPSTRSNSEQKTSDAKESPPQSND